MQVYNIECNFLAVKIYRAINYGGKNPITIREQRRNSNIHKKASGAAGTNLHIRLGEARTFFDNGNVFVPRVILTFILFFISNSNSVPA